MIRLLEKLIAHPESRYSKRVMNILKSLLDIHILVGFTTVAIYAFEEPLALLFGGGFLGYQCMQLYKKHDDKSWFNVGGFLWGIGLGGAILFILSLYGII